MKSCTRFSIMISRSLDSDLNDDEKNELYEHLVSCRSCETTLQTFSAIKKTVANCYALDVVPLTVRGPLLRRHRGFSWPVFSRKPWKPAMALLLLTGFIAMALIVAGFHRPVSPSIVLVDQSTTSVLAAPLGSMIYYEEIASKATRIQCAEIKVNPMETLTIQPADSATKLSYQSSLLCDGELLNTAYKMMTYGHFTYE